MIILTGGAGFIGSAFLWKLNQEGIKDVLVVDHLQTSSKWKNLVGLSYSNYLHKDLFLDSLQNPDFLADTPIEAVIHLGACSSTTERDMDYLMRNNVYYSQVLCNWALERGAYFMYASSAATYGSGEMGFSDDHSLLSSFLPINPYGYSKHLFDLHLQRHGLLSSVVGLKFFNVFGPNEFHKADMRSLVCKSYGAVSSGESMKLFRSYVDSYEDGGQMRDFIYVKDCVEMMWWLLQNKQCNGIFNIGSGIARSWNDVASALFLATEQPLQIEYIDMPESIRSQYQYFTEAPMDKFLAMGGPAASYSLEGAVSDYVTSYLSRDAYLMS